MNEVNKLFPKCPICGSSLHITGDGSPASYDRTIQIFGCKSCFDANKDCYFRYRDGVWIDKDEYYLKLIESQKKPVKKSKGKRR